MIKTPLDFLEDVVRSIGIKNVIREKAQQNQMAIRPHCHLIPQKGDVEKDFTKSPHKAKDIESGRITHYIRKWIVKNPVRVVFVAGRDCEEYGAKFLAALPKGFEADGQYIDVNVTAELPPIDDSLLYDAGEIAYDVTFTSGVFVPLEEPMFKDAQIHGEIEKPRMR